MHLLCMKVNEHFDMIEFIREINSPEVHFMSYSNNFIIFKFGSLPRLFCYLWCNHHLNTSILFNLLQVTTLMACTHFFTVSCLSSGTLAYPQSYFKMLYYLAIIILLYNPTFAL